MFSFNGLEIYTAYRSMIPIKVTIKPTNTYFPAMIDAVEVLWISAKASWRGGNTSSVFSMTA